jgi:hypothetical protein
MYREIGAISLPNRCFLMNTPSMDISFMHLIKIGKDE